MTITQTDERGGIVEWFKLPEGEMDQAMVGRFWTPVVNCADEVTRKAASAESAAL